MGMHGDVFESTSRRISDVRGAHTSDLTGIVENARWLATLALAEMAGIATYRDLTGASDLSLPFVVVIIGLSAAVTAFIWAVLKARSERATLETMLQKVMAKATELKNDGNVADNDGDKRIGELRETTIEAVGKNLTSAAWWEKVGLFLLGGASVFAALFLFLAELWATLSSWSTRAA